MFPSGIPQNRGTGFQPPPSGYNNQLSPYNSSHQQQYQPTGLYPNSGQSVNYYGGNFYNFTFVTPGSYNVTMEHQPREMRGNGGYHNHAQETTPAGIMRGGQFSSYHHHQNHVPNAPNRRGPVPTCEVDSMPRLETSARRLSSDPLMSSQTSSSNWSTQATFGSTPSRILMSESSKEEDDDSVDDYPCSQFRVVRFNQSM